MVTQEQLVGWLMEESEKAISGPIDDWIASVPAGTFLLPFPVILGLLGVATFDAITAAAGNLKNVPLLVAGRIIVDEAAPEDSTKVVTLRAAKRYAAQLALGAMYELAGTNPPNSLSVAIKGQSIKGIRKRLIAVEERQILGRTLARLFHLIRAPVKLVLTVLKFVWQTLVGIAALGAIIVVWQIVSSDWTRTALSQKHPRKRLKNQRINKRL